MGGGGLDIISPSSQAPFAADTSAAATNLFLDLHRFSRLNSCKTVQSKLKIAIIGGVGQAIVRSVGVQQHKPTF